MVTPSAILVDAAFNVTFRVLQKEDSPELLGAVFCR